MNDKFHRIEVYDPSDYTGPDPMRVHGLGIVHGPERMEYYLVKPDAPLDLDGCQIEQILLRPRYFQDKIARVENDACTVSIYCVKADCSLSPEDHFELSSVERWGAGKITPCRLK